MRPHFEFVFNDLSVSYQASPEPQELVVRLTTTQPPVRPSHFQMHAAVMAVQIQEGGAGGAEFHPALGKAAVPDVLAHGPMQFEARIRHQAVSHRFILQVVEQFSFITVDAASLLVQGSLPRVDPNMSVTEKDIVRMLEEPQAHPAQWPDLGFELERTSSAQGVEVKVEFLNEMSAPVYEKIQNRLIGLCNFLSWRSDDDGNPVYATDVGARIPTFGRKKKIAIATYGHIGQAREPAIALIANLLCRFHHEEAPIRHVRVAF